MSRPLCFYELVYVMVNVKRFDSDHFIDFCHYIDHFISFLRNRNVK